MAAGPELVNLGHLGRTSCETSRGHYCTTSRSKSVAKTRCIRAHMDWVHARSGLTLSSHVVAFRPAVRKCLGVRGTYPDCRRMQTSLVFFRCNIFGWRTTSKSCLSGSWLPRKGKKLGKSNKPGSLAPHALLEVHWINNCNRFPLTLNPPLI